MVMGTRLLGLLLQTVLGFRMRIVRLAVVSLASSAYSNRPGVEARPLHAAHQGDRALGLRPRACSPDHPVTIPRADTQETAMPGPSSFGLVLTEPGIHKGPRDVFAIPF